ncbi:MAG: phage minor capsid protein [Clostridia bacterium]|nr:phage minor capsid protein [Clostridia bacterium]
MITPDWLSNELNILQVHKELQESILRDITRRIIKTDFTVTDTAAWQAEKLQQSGMLYKDILKEISKETGKSQEEINRAFKDAHTEVFKYDESELEAAGEDAKEFKHMSPQMKAVFTAALKKASKEIKNLTGTTAVTSQSAFIRACDLAHNKIVSGAFTYQDAIKDAIKTAAKEGVTIVYPSGHVSSLDAAVRRAVLSGVNQTTGTLVKMRAEETGHDLMQLSAHSGAREDHADWQGKIVSLSGRKGYLTLADIGYGEVTGFMGAHCRHTWFIFYEGISKPAYTKEQLESFKNETVTYEGEVIPLRQALDRQRAMERSIRRSKQELVMFDEAAKNLKNGDKLAMQVEFEKAAVKLKGKEAKLKDFCDKTGLRRDRYREQVFATQTENGIKNFGKSASRKAVQSARKRYNEFVSVVGKEHAPATLDKYYELKYNDKEYYRFLSLDYNRKNSLLKNVDLALPSADTATAHEDKFVKYLFNPNNPIGFAKGENFRKRLGYDINNWQELQNELIQRATQYPAKFKGSTAYGDKYEQAMIIYGKKGTPANVIASWCLDDEGIHLTSAYIKEVKK